MNDNIYNIDGISEKIANVNFKNNKDIELAAANYLLCIAPKLIEDEITPDGTWIITGVTYDPIVEQIIETHSLAVELILSLQEGYSYVGGTGVQFACNMIERYMNKQFSSGLGRTR